MNIEHCGCLSLLLRRHECHEQDGEMLRAAGLQQIDIASGDPAMAFDLPLNGRAIIQPVFHIGSALAAGLTADRSGIRSRRANAPITHTLTGGSQAAQ
jgi:hypothetical protein